MCRGRCSLFPICSDPDFGGGIVCLFENYGDELIELRKGEAYVQLIPVKYFNGPVLGANDFCFRLQDPAFGSAALGATSSNSTHDLGTDKLMTNAAALAQAISQFADQEVTVETVLTLEPDEQEEEEEEEEE